jgi:hypothetical protein
MLLALTTLAHDQHTRERIAAHNSAVLPTVSWPAVLDRAEILYAAAQQRAASHARAQAGRTRRRIIRPVSRTGR